MAKLGLALGNLENLPISRGEMGSCCDAAGRAGGVSLKHAWYANKDDTGGTPHHHLPTTELRPLMLLRCSSADEVLRVAAAFTEATAAYGDAVV
uniref:Uncharacterized protein n=1 Tax=Knipowitschia caucasica TaxID=637954 RepID=A0AAV2LBW7_KNICA